MDRQLSGFAYKHHQLVKYFFSKKKALRALEKKNNKVKKALMRGRKLPKPRLAAVTIIGRVKSETEHLFNEMMFEKKQADAGIKRQFSEYEDPQLHPTAEQLWFNTRKLFPPEKKNHSVRSIKH